MQKVLRGHDGERASDLWRETYFEWRACQGRFKVGIRFRYKWQRDTIVLRSLVWSGERNLLVSGRNS
jgi:hypothetical protein